MTDRSAATVDFELLASTTASMMQHKLQQVRLVPNLSSLLPSELDSALSTNGPTSSAVNRDGDLSEVTQAAVSRDSTVNVALAVLTVFVLAPLIICSNALLLAAFRRSKRLRTPSNCLVASLAFADLTVGLFLPFGIYFELARPGVTSALVCLLPYSIVLVLSAVSLLSMTAIALDRYTSLARPLRYNNIITKATVGRYVATFWFYAIVVGSAPIFSYFYYYSGSEHYKQIGHFACSVYIVGPEVRIFLFCAMFAPCALVILFCYVYVYIVARYHAHAIYSVELSMRQNSDYRSTNSEANKTPQPSASPRVSHQQKHHHHHHHHHHHQNSFHPRYGRTLAMTVGLFLILWGPAEVTTLVDALWAERTLPMDSVRRKGQDYIHWLAFLSFTNSALNPWVYGYRNTEFRIAYRRILEDLFVKLGVVVKREKHYEHHGVDPERVVINGDISGLHSPCCHSNVRLCVSPNHLTMTTSLKPCAYVQKQQHTPSMTTTVVDGNSIGCTITNNQDGTVIICETIITTTEVH